MLSCRIRAFYAHQSTSLLTVFISYHKFQMLYWMCATRSTFHEIFLCWWIFLRAWFFTYFLNLLRNLFIFTIMFIFCNVIDWYRFNYRHMIFGPTKINKSCTWVLISTSGFLLILETCGNCVMKEDFKLVRFRKFV